MRTAFDYLSCKELPDDVFTVALVAPRYGSFQNVFLHINFRKVIILSFNLRKEHLSNEEYLVDTAKRKIAEINEKFNRHISLQKDC